MSARQPAVKVPKKGQRGAFFTPPLVALASPTLLTLPVPFSITDRSDESGPFGNDFKLTTSSRALLRGAGVQRALQCLFEFYRKSIQPHGSKVLFSDIAVRIGKHGRVPRAVVHLRCACVWGAWVM